jgi:hypothetical protein
LSEELEMTAYRDDVSALAARHQALSAQLEEKTRELAEAAQLLEEARARRRLPVLESLRVASPCAAAWEQMTGDDRVRSCAACQKDVFNLSELTRYEAEALLLERAGKLCVRYYQRKDGTILLQDCAVGVAGKRKRRLLAAGAAALLAGPAGYLAGDHLFGAEAIAPAQEAPCYVLGGAQMLDTATAVEDPAPEPAEQADAADATDDRSAIMGDIARPDPEHVEELRARFERIKRLKDRTAEELEELRRQSLQPPPER